MGVKKKASRYIDTEPEEMKKRFRKSWLEGKLQAAH